ncbi:MAG: sugar transferase [Prevotella sp.]|nr:sugar transferase [Prevotella sp.]
MEENNTPKYKLNTDKNDPRYIADGMNEFERNVKRVGDLILAGICLIVFSPLFLICYLAIKHEDGGPAIFKQERIGRFGRPFTIYKFRSMVVDAEKDGPALFQHENEKRMTKIGKFLRDHHLDELPQLWNVFKGDMAFIGPRPERKYYIDQIIKHDPRYVYLYQIRPGVTSYATLYNGYTDTMEKMLRRLEIDLYYLEHRSWWFDAVILFKTFINIIFGKKF